MPQSGAWISRSGFMSPQFHIQVVGSLSGTGWKARSAAHSTVQSCKQVCKTGQTEIKASRTCVLAVLLSGIPAQHVRCQDLEAEVRRHKQEEEKRKAEVLARFKVPVASNLPVRVLHRCSWSGPVRCHLAFPGAGHGVLLCDVDAPFHCSRSEPQFSVEGSVGKLLLFVACACRNNFTVSGRSRVKCK